MHGDFALSFRTHFSQGLELANTGYGTSFHFKTTNFQHFAILLDNNIIVATQLLKTMLIFKNF